MNILLENKNLNNEKEYNLKLSNFINYYNIKSKYKNNLIKNNIKNNELQKPKININYALRVENVPKDNVIKYLKNQELINKRFKNNDCKHKNLLKLYLTEEITELKYKYGKDILKNFVDHYPNEHNKNQNVNCKLCGFKLFCMHEIYEMKNLYNESKDIEKKLEEKYYIEEKDIKQCKYCGVVIEPTKLINYDRYEDNEIVTGSIMNSELEKDFIYSIRNILILLGREFDLNYKDIWIEVSNILINEKPKKDRIYLVTFYYIAAIIIKHILDSNINFVKNDIVINNKTIKINNNQFNKKELSIYLAKILILKYKKIRENYISIKLNELDQKQRKKAQYGLIKENKDKVNQKIIKSIAEIIEELVNKKLNIITNLKTNKNVVNLDKIKQKTNLYKIITNENILDNLTKNKIESIEYVNKWNVISNNLKKYDNNKNITANECKKQDGIIIYLYS